MNDLLSESFEIPRGQGSRGGDIEMGMNSADLGLENFFKKVQEIEKQNEKLDKLLKKLQDAHEESKAVTKAPAMKGIKQRMEKDVDEVGKIARSVKSKLEELDRENLSNRQKPGCGKGTGVDRSRTSTTIQDMMKLSGLNLQFETERRFKSDDNITAVILAFLWENILALKKKLKDKMAEFQTLREIIHQEYREVVERRVFTVTGTRADEETIDRLIETGDSEQIFQKAIQEQGRGQVLKEEQNVEFLEDIMSNAFGEIGRENCILGGHIMDTLAEIQERHDAVRELERKLLELQQIFLDMAVLVDAQGDLLDNIESQVSNAVDHVQSGNVALQKAKKLQRNSRKWMCIAIIILLIIVVIIVVAVIKPWSNKKGA
ncbi:unnamed protein product [Dovyalis caffra]|uniref:t-SNARE coiled-coil homology domain-containing protein n=1 Tax=Dovyalis caffra TaxID=77055 RepID=A0AAV1RXZ1_9ROSI|nr:unnamed protein product [Dovyalis caffra]